MPTYTALTTLPGEPAATALAEALEALGPLGVGVFEIEDGAGLWEVGGYFDSPPDAVQLALLAAAHGAREFAVSELPEIDWVAKVRRELAPVEAGRFFVHGGHDAGQVPEGRVALLIEAAMAFGTGHHGTTQGCLRALERLLAAGEEKTRVADIGCGTAVLAMAAARVWPGAEVVASDIDPVAVEVAEANLIVNGLRGGLRGEPGGGSGGEADGGADGGSDGGADGEPGGGADGEPGGSRVGRVDCVVAAGFAHPRLAGPFDLVFANILMGPLIELAPEIAARLAPGGHAVLSGLLTTQAERVLAAYRAAGLVQEAREDLGEWATLVLRRPG